MTKSFSCAVAIALGACGPEPKAYDAKPNDVDALRAEMKVVVRAEARLAYQNWSGGGAVDAGEAFRGHEALFSPATAERLLEAMSAINRNEEPGLFQAMRLLRRRVLWEVAGEKLAGAGSALSAIKESETFTAAGKTYRLSELHAALALEKDPLARRQIYEASRPLIDRLNTLAEESRQKAIDAARALGASSPAALGGELRLTDLNAAAAEAERFLRQSDDLYIRALRAQARLQTDLDAEKLRACDYPRLVSFHRFDRHFSEDAALPAVQATLAVMGLDLANPAIHVEGEKKPGKNPRPAVFALDVPGDVRLSFVPRAGFAALASLFHEAGHAVYHAAATTPVFEFQYMADDAAREAYGALFEQLAANPEWLRGAMARIPAAEQKALAQFSAFRQLLRARRYAARLLFELGWSAGQVSDPVQLYQNYMSRAVGYHFDQDDARRWFYDQEPLFYSADMLRAWMLGAALEAQLAQAFGERWFERKDAGAFLREQWAQGGALTADALAVKISGHPVDGQALVKILQARMGKAP